MLYSVFMLALRSVRRNMLRSFLTILGIVIGVSAVITPQRLVSSSRRHRSGCSQAPPPPPTPALFISTATSPNRS